MAGDGDTWRPSNPHASPRPHGHDINRRTAHACIQDVFPGHHTVSAHNPTLADAVTAAAASAGLQPCDSFIRKCLHLDGTLAGRFGVMVIGGGGCGKSAVISTLLQARNALAAASAASSPWSSAEAVSCCYINPKACSLAELYGQHNEVTGEWREGLLSSALRSAMAQGMHTKTWVVLDGPIDSAWVENLNTVLDDSRVLCLASGERMRLSAQRINVVFEVDDLSAASPATVSRCGMVFVPESTLTWRDAVEPWLARLPACMRAGAPTAAVPFVGRGGVGVEGGVGADEGFMQCGEYLRELFEKHVEGGLAWMDRNVDEAVAMSPQQRVRLMCLWLQVLLRPGGGWSCEDGFGVAERAAVSCMFAFAFVWGLGGGLRRDSRAAWDTEVRRRFDGEANFPERSGTVFEYCCNPARNFSFQVCLQRAVVHAHRVRTSVTASFAAGCPVQCMKCSAGNPSHRACHRQLSSFADPLIRPAARECSFLPLCLSCCLDGSPCHCAPRVCAPFAMRRVLVLMEASVPSYVI